MLGSQLGFKLCCNLSGVALVILEVKYFIDLVFLYLGSNSWNGAKSVP